MLAACQQDTPVSVEDERGLVPAAQDELPVNPATVEAVASILDAINASLEADGAGYRAYSADYVTAPASGEAGNTVLAKDTGNKQLDFDFVPFD